MCRYCYLILIGFLSILVFNCKEPELGLFPGILIQVDGQLILDGSITYNLGSTAVGTPLAVVFTVSNPGTAALVMNDSPRVAVAGTGFCLTTDLPGEIPAGNTAAFTLTFNPPVKDALSGTISIANNVTERNPYNFIVKGTGTVTECNAPYMIILTNSIPILDGSKAYDLGTATVGTSKHICFIVRNTGTATLVLTASPAVAISGNGFSLLTDALLTTLSTGKTTVFIVSFSPPAPGTYTGVISIANNDLAHNPYNFTVTGTGTEH